ncbi:hypothetical protein [Streptomyces sp. CB01635]|uniref:hypothetical protein n=1 Tax=unclassified Streptomyces TaxID=2593676 RepID=UPI001F40FE74|nr:hypothetical protein [Streptomyces sp. CB01635]
MADVPLEQLLHARLVERPAVLEVPEGPDDPPEGIVSIPMPGLDIKVPLLGGVRAPTTGQ